ncbi:hypothetical protein RHMOL_Rhmol12G0045300 [Rhododendron molle]|uniref:Uncharacterized protein n=1 Tax=Rhododendron molle TaxID=49168 RepID=A0ACC0LE64_RHOML|nr:hypothetical protein RHMOL_Rhmol12G0045300 [Rhododendron molle]
MAPKREKEETELKVRPSPPLRSSIQPPPRLDHSSRSKRFDRRLEITPPPPTPTRRRQQTAAAERRKVNRCSGCWRKVGLTKFRCRCGDLFCSEHRYSDRHDCSYDYKAAGREAIERENPVVRPAKNFTLR